MNAKMYAAALAAVFAAASTAGMLAHSAGNPASGPQGWLAGSSAAALADQDDNHKDKHKKDEQGQNNGYYQNGVWYPNNNENGGNDGDNNDDNQGDRGPHNCNNPSGQQRGWCKHHGHRNNGNNTRITGTVLSVSGNTVTLLQGLRSIRINDQNALNNGRANNLYPTRTVTAYGYWRGGVFYATSIG